MTRPSSPGYTVSRCGHSSLSGSNSKTKRRGKKKKKKIIYNLPYIFCGAAAYGIHFNFSIKCSSMFFITGWPLLVRCISFWLFFLRSSRFCICSLCFLLRSSIASILFRCSSANFILAWTRWTEEANRRWDPDLCVRIGLLRSLLFGFLGRWFLRVYLLFSLSLVVMYTRCSRFFFLFFLLGILVRRCSWDRLTLWFRCLFSLGARLLGFIACSREVFKKFPLCVLWLSCSREELEKRSQKSRIDRGRGCPVWRIGVARMRCTLE